MKKIVLLVVAFLAVSPCLSVASTHCSRRTESSIEYTGALCKAVAAGALLYGSFCWGKKLFSESSASNANVIKVGFCAGFAGFLAFYGFKNAKQVWQWLKSERILTGPTRPIKGSDALWRLIGAALAGHSAYWFAKKGNRSLVDLTLIGVHAGIALIWLKESGTWAVENL